MSDEAKATPAPLPPEEIERLKEYAKRIAPLWSVSTFNDRHIVSGEGGVMADVWWTHARGLIIAAVNALPALLAEIEAGRAGAERVRELEAEVARLRLEVEPWVADAIAAECAALRQAAQPSDGAPPSMLDPPGKEMVDWLTGYLGEVTKSGGAKAAANHIICTLRAHWGSPTTPVAPAQVGAQPSELERLRNEVASLRVSLGQPADRPAEPIGCPAPGACACPSVQPAPDMVQRHEKQLAAWVDAHPVFGPAHRAYEASKAAQPAGRVEADHAADVLRAFESARNTAKASPYWTAERRETLEHVRSFILNNLRIATPPTAGAVDDRENDDTTARSAT